MKKWSGLPLVIFGNGDIALETHYLINCINKFTQLNMYDFKGYVSEKEVDVGTEIFGVPVVASDESFEEFIKSFEILGVAVPHASSKIKRKIVNKIKSFNNLVFPNIIHPSVDFDKKCVSLGVGNVITAGVKFTTNILVGNFNLFNLNCTVGHETEIKDYCTINPLTAISGGVKINEGVFIGTGAKILQYRTIGEYAIIGAGAVVIKDVESYNTEVGVPAKCIRNDKSNA